MYYLYVYLNPLKLNENENLPFKHEAFYVGRGKGNRYKAHLQKYRLKKDNIKNKLIKEILSNNLEPEIIIYESGLTFTESNNLERELIKEIGRIVDNSGTLTNITSGGQGIEGFKMSDETINKVKRTLTKNGFYKKLSESMKGDKNQMYGERWHRSEEGKKNFSEKMKGIYPLEKKNEKEKKEIFNKISNSLKGYKWEEEEKVKRSEGMKKVWKERKEKNVKTIKKVVIINIKSNEEKEFESMSKASKYLKVSNWTLRNRFEKGKMINNFKIKSIK